MGSARATGAELDMTKWEFAPSVLEELLKIINEYEEQHIETIAVKAKLLRALTETVMQKQPVLKLFQEQS